MRRMVGPEHIDHALLEAAPNPLAMRTIPDRRLYLSASAQLLIAVRRHERPMMRSSLNRGYVLVVTEELHFLRGRDVENVDTLAGLACEADEALRAGQRRHIVAPDRMRARIALHTQMLARIQSVLILGVERGTTPDDLEDVAHALVILDQQRARRRAHEHLHAGTARQPFELRQCLRILTGASHEERKIAVHPVVRAGDLVSQRLRTGCRRLGIRHLEYCGDAAHDGAA